MAPRPQHGALLVVVVATALALVPAGAGAQAPPYTDQYTVTVQKCCEKAEVMLNNSCAKAATYNTSLWTPVFTDENGEEIEVTNFRYVIGLPECETTQLWPIYHLKDSQDKLVILKDGKLRHYIYHQQRESVSALEDRSFRRYGSLHDIPDEDDEENQEPMFYDYEPGKYCVDKLVYYSANSTDDTALFAKVCAPEIDVSWTDVDFLMRRLINPIFHGFAMIFFLIVSIVYFIMPTLRDLTGNIITTISICLIFSQAADMVRIFTEFSSHVSFLVADTLLYISMLAAFFWLNSLGFYIWKTFRSRNVFLRVTDGRKYCYYSCYAWGCTLFMTALALFAHFMLDTVDSKKKYGNHKAIITNGDQETIGWLGIAVFFTPIAFTVIINVFFYVTTLKVINRMNTYGRIHHKLKHNFDMFLLMFLVMTISWLFFLLSWLKYDGLMYAHIVMNAIQAPLILYICVFRQKHVMFLLRKSCCYNEPVPTSDWGDEMVEMNASSY